MDPLPDDLPLPGWDSSYPKEDVKAAAFEGWEESLWDNLQRFS